MLLDLKAYVNKERKPYLFIQWSKEMRYSGLLMLLLTTGFLPYINIENIRASCDELVAVMFGDYIWYASLKKIVSLIFVADTTYIDLTVLNVKKWHMTYK